MSARRSDRDPPCRRPAVDDTIPAPRGWSPQTTLAGYFPAIAELCRTILPEIRAIEQQLDRDEAAGGDTVRPRQAIGELQWRLQYTGDAAAAAKTFERVRALAAEPPSAGSSRDEQGSFGIGTDVWFLKLDASVDPMLADDFDIGDNPPRLSRPHQRPRPSAELISTALSSHALPKTVSIAARSSISPPQISFG